MAFDSFNIARQEERTRLANSAHKGFDNGLSSVYPNDALRHDLDLFCWHLPETWENSPERIGTPAIRISLEKAAVPPRWLLRPMIHCGQPTLLFADGGSGKSILGEMIATIVACAWRENPLRLEPGAYPVPTLYLDWETDEQEITWRLGAMKAGMPSDVGFEYRPCSRPLHDDLDRIQRIIREKNIGFIVADSLGGAVGGDLKENEAANRYFSAMRTLGCASLTMTHITKEARDKSKASPFGSAYFWNWARSVWELQKSQEPDERSVHVALHHRKANNTRLMKALAFRFEFENEDDTLKEVMIKRIAIEDIAELSKGLSIPKRVLLLLKRGPLQAKDIAEELEISVGMARVAVNRLSKSGELVKLGSSWALGVEEEPPF